MSLPLLATLDQFESWIGATVDDSARAQGYLASASARARAITGRTWVDDDDELEDVPDEVLYIVIESAARKYNNPKGVIHDVAGPFSARYAEAAAEGVYITDEERRILERYRASSGLWTLATTRGDTPDTGDYVDPHTGTIYLPVEGGEPIPHRNPA